jgi:hypothetical protein
MVHGVLLSLRCPQTDGTQGTKFHLSSFIHILLMCNLE